MRRKGKNIDTSIYTMMLATSRCCLEVFRDLNVKAVIFLDPDLETYAEMVILFFFCVPFFSGFLG